MYEKWLNILHESILFSNIPDEELMGMLNCLKPVIFHFEKNETIALEGTFMKGIGIILEGKGLIHKEDYDGSRNLIHLLETGDIFGEMIAFSGKRIWPVTVSAQTDTSVMFFTPEKIIGSCPNACISHRTLLLNMLKILSEKGINLSRKINYLSIKSIRKKIAVYLLEEHKKNKSLIFMLSLNRNELAEFLNVTRPSLSREMGNMKAENIIDFHRSTVKITNIEKLKKINSDTQ